MKKLLYLVFFAVIILSSCKKKTTDEEVTASFVILDERGQEISSGSEFTFNTTDQQASFGIQIKNTSSAQIKMRTKLVEVNGTDGSQFEVCIGSCYPSMQLNTAYPLGTPFTVSANSTTAPNEVHYWNHYDGNCYYVVEIYQVDDEGNRIGEPFSFKYIHQ